MSSEASRTQGTGGLRQAFEQRLQFGQAALFSIRDGGFQPLFDGHVGVLQRFTEMATPSRSGTIEVSSSGCVLMRTL